MNGAIKWTCPTHGLNWKGYVWDVYFSSSSACVQGEVDRPTRGHAAPRGALGAVSGVPTSETTVDGTRDRQKSTKQKDRVLACLERWFLVELM